MRRVRWTIRVVALVGVLGLVIACGVQRYEGWLAFVGQHWGAIAVGTAFLIVALAMLRHVREPMRSLAMRRLASRLGLDFIGRDEALAPSYDFLDTLHTGQGGAAYNVLSGVYGGYLVWVFDYNPLAPGFSRTETPEEGVDVTVLLLEHSGQFPKVLIRPAGLAPDLSPDGIEMESIEFSKAFRLRSKDRRVAYALCHPRMMEYLLAHRDLSVEVDCDCVALSVGRRLKPDEIPGRLDQLVAIVNLFPEYLYRS